MTVAAWFVAVAVSCAPTAPTATDQRPIPTVSATRTASPTPWAPPPFVEDPTISLAPADGLPETDGEISADEGDLIARITSRRLGLVRSPIRMGVTPEVLARGIGLYPGSEYPDEGNFALAGHRVTPVAGLGHGPFRDLDELRLGDHARVFLGGKVYVFTLRRVIIVLPTQVGVLHPDRAALTMTSCHPPGSSTMRIVAFWNLWAVRPVPTP